MDQGKVDISGYICAEGTRKHVEIANSGDARRLFFAYCEKLDGEGTQSKRGFIVNPCLAREPQGTHFLIGVGERHEKQNLAKMHN